MAHISIGGGSIRVALTPGERLLARHRGDIVVPLSHVRAVRVVRDGLVAAHGLRSPALGIPAVRKIGTWGPREQRRFFSVRRGQPAVQLRCVPGSPWHTLLIGTDHPEAAASAVAAALPPTRRDDPVLIDPGSQALRGSLRVPGPGPQPAALLLAGSGPIDRDGDAPGAPLGLQLALAESLAAAGIASLRFDRRGIDDGTDWRTVSFTENTRDAAAALRALRADPRIDTGRIVVIGHSEGALHALRLAVGAAPPAAAVLLSSPARPGSEVLLWQAEQVQPSLPAPVKAIVRVARIDLTAKTRAAHDKLRATTTNTARINGATVNAGWFREFLDEDPRDDLRALAVPTLALTGTADLQTPAADTEVIAELAPGPVTVARPDGISHLLRRDPGAVPTLGDYKRQIRQPVDSDVLATVTDWVVDRLGR